MAQGRGTGGRYLVDDHRERCVPTRAVRSVGAADLTGREIMTAFDTGSRLVFSTGTEVEVLTRYERHWTTSIRSAVRSVGAADLTGREIMTAFDTGSRLVFSTGTEVEVLTRYERHWTTGF